METMLSHLLPRNSTYMNNWQASLGIRQQKTTKIPQSLVQSEDMPQNGTAESSLTRFNWTVPRMYSGSSFSSFACNRFSSLASYIDILASKLKWIISTHTWEEKKNRERQNIASCSRPWLTRIKFNLILQCHGRECDSHYPKKIARNLISKTFKSNHNHIREHSNNLFWMKDICIMALALKKSRAELQLNI